MVEFALVLPVFLLLFATVLDLGRIAAAQIAVNNAAREGAFQAAQTPGSYVQNTACDQSTNLVTCRVQLEAKGSVVSVAPSDIAMSCSPTSCATGLGNTVTVSVKGHFQLLTTILSSFFGGSQNIAFTASATNQIETLPAAAATSSTATLSTSMNETVAVGSAIHDTATIAGGVNPTGTIVFKAYGPSDSSCAAAPAFTSGVVTVNGDAAYTISFTPASAGTYYWIAAYSGDANNPALTGACGDPGEIDTVTATATPTPTPVCLPPSAGFTYTVSPSNHKVPVTLTVLDTSTPTSSGCITTWTWTWGDGSFNTGQIPNSNPPGQHTYNVVGTYYMSLTVTSPLGSSTSGTVKVDVNP
jgi:Flp pilus assembly protein TadG